MSTHSTKIEFFENANNANHQYIRHLQKTRKLHRLLPMQFRKEVVLLMIADYYHWNVAKSILSFSIQPSLMHEVTC